MAVDSSKKNLLKAQSSNIRKPEELYLVHQMFENHDRSPIDHFQPFSGPHVHIAYFELDQ